MFLAILVEDKEPNNQANMGGLEETTRGPNSATF